MTLFFYLLSLLMNYFPVVFLIYIFFLQIFKKSLGRVLKSGILFYLALVLIYAGFQTLFQYRVWQLSNLSKYLLPPWQPLSYFLGYSWQHYIFEPVLRVEAALIIFLGVWRLNKFFEERFFHFEELELTFFCLSSLPLPKSIVFIGLIPLVLLAGHVLKRLFFSYNEETRIGIYYFLAPIWFVINFLYGFLPLPSFISSLHV